MTRKVEKIAYVDKEWVTPDGRVIDHPIVGDIVDVELTDPDYDDALFVLGLTITVAGLVVKSRGT